MYTGAFNNVNAALYNQYGMFGMPQASMAADVQNIAPEAEQIARAIYASVSICVVTKIIKLFKFKKNCSDKCEQCCIVDFVSCQQLCAFQNPGISQETLKERVHAYLQQRLEQYRLFMMHQVCILFTGFAHILE